MPRDRRTAFILIPEHLNTNTHAHGLIRVAADRLAEFEDMFRAPRSLFWSRLAPAGTHDVQPIYDERGWAHYCLKLAHADTEWITSDEHLPEHAVAA